MSYSKNWLGRWNKTKYSINDARNYATEELQNKLKLDEKNGIILSEDDFRKNSKNDIPERGQWGHEIEFLLSCVGWSIGFSNVWRFPYVAYSNGGGAFLFPYFFLLMVIGKPMYFLEVALGQFSSLGPLGVWKCFPLAKGVGVAMVMVCFVVSINYNVLMAYTMFFLWQSFKPVLPWSGCFEWWGADPNTCYVRTHNQSICQNATRNENENYLARELTVMPLFHNKTTGNSSFDIWNQTNDDSANCTEAIETSSQQFWNRYVLDISPGIEHVGTLKLDLVLCLFISWCLVYMCLAKGVKTSGKVVYFTATFPYVCLIALLTYGVTLDGASTGLKYLFLPKWERMFDMKIWMAAASQLFYSLGLSWGGLIMYGSYNRFDIKAHRYVFIVTSLDFFTSIMSGTVIFSVLGKLAKDTGLSIEDVVQAEQGLAFVAYPEALAQLWVPQLWSFLFFFMFLLLGVDSGFALLETCTTVLYDEVPKTRNYKPIIALCICSFCFIAGLPCVTQGGAYVFHIMDYFGGSFVLLFIAIFELTGIMCGYGIKRICSDFEMMLGIKINYYFQASWLVASPLILSFIFIYGMLNDETIKYENTEYPPWAIAIGWMLASLSMCQIPLWAIYMLVKHRNNLQYVIYPTSDWGPENPEIRKKWMELNNSRKEVKLSGIDNPAINETEI